MPEVRASNLMVLLEPSISALVDMVKGDLTRSGYARACIIRDLASKGMLSQDMLVGIMTGASEAELKNLTASVNANNK